MGRIKFDKILGRIRAKDGLTAAEIQALIDESLANVTGEENPTRLASGEVTWIEDLDFLVSPLEYEILGLECESSEIIITIPANAEANPRFAVIYADIFGNVSYILGDAAANPLVPTVNRSTQFLVTQIYIPALGTEPGADPGGETNEITSEVIYNENAEWPTSKTEGADTAINFDAVTDPGTDAKHIKVDFAAAAGGAYSFQEIQTSNYSVNTNIDIAAETATIEKTVSELIPWHKTEVLGASLRTVSYATIRTRRGLTITLTNTDNGDSRWLKALTLGDYGNYEVEELDLSVNVPGLIQMMIISGAPIAAGNYDLRITGFIRNDAIFQVAAAETFPAGTSEIVFTRAAALAVGEGTISMQLKTSADWLSTTGLLFELYNGAVRVGSLAMLPGNMFYYNPLLAVYQDIVLPLSAFNLVGNNITKLVITPVNDWPNNSSLQIDNVVLQSGVDLPTNENAVSIGDWVEDIAFEFRDVEAAGEYILDIAASFPYKIIEAVFQTDAGTITADIDINGTGILSCATDAAVKTFAPVVDASVTPGQPVRLTIAALDGAAALIGKLRIIRT